MHTEGAQLVGCELSFAWHQMLHGRRAEIAVPCSNGCRCRLSWLQADHILLLDSFFYVVIFHGTTVATWRKAEYHKQPEHAAFAELLTVRLSARLVPNKNPLRFRVAST